MNPRFVAPVVKPGEDRERARYRKIIDYEEKKKGNSPPQPRNRDWEIVSARFPPRPSIAGYCWKWRFRADSLPARGADSSRLNVCRFDLQPSSFLVPSFLPSSLPERSDSLPSRPSFADLFAKQNATESRVNIPLPIPRILSFFLFTVRDFPFSSFSGLIWWIYLRIFVEECLRGMIEFGFEDRYDYIIDE